MTKHASPSHPPQLGTLPWFLHNNPCKQNDYNFLLFFPLSLTHTHTGKDNGNRFSDQPDTCIKKTFLFQNKT